MYIAHQRKLIFLHAQKTGGTALTVALEKHVAQDDIIVGDRPNASTRNRDLPKVRSSGPIWKHSGLKDLYGLLTPEQIDSYLKVTIARNPWDRMVSYYHWLRSRNFKLPAVDLAKRASFEDFIAHPYGIQPFRGHSIRAFMADKDGRYYADFVLRFEELQTDADRLSEMLGQDLGALPRVNMSKRDARYQSYYSDTTRAIVADVFREDIEMMGYVFD